MTAAKRRYAHVVIDPTRAQDVVVTFNEERMG